jgi:two-component system OmpR family response regulator
MYCTTNVSCISKVDRSPLPGLAGLKDAADESSGLMRKVLVVDDEQDLADLTGSLLNAYGLDAIVVYSGQYSLRVLQSDSEIDGILADVMMPEMNGLQLADAVREIYPTVKIVLTSAYSRLPLFQAGKRPYRFVAKPYMIATVLELLKT